MQFQGEFSQNKDIFCNGISYKAQCLFGETMWMSTPEERLSPHFPHSPCWVVPMPTLCHYPTPCQPPSVEAHRTFLSSHKPQSHVLLDAIHQTYEKELTAITTLYVLNFLHAFKTQLMALTLYSKHVFLNHLLENSMNFTFPYVTLSSAALDLQAISCLGC